MRFKVGDRVICIKDAWHHSFTKKIWIVDRFFESFYYCINSELNPVPYPFYESELVEYSPLMMELI